MAVCRRDGCMYVGLLENIEDLFSFRTGESNLSLSSIYAIY